jgi:hypothetical protein
LWSDEDDLGELDFLPLDLVLCFAFVLGRDDFVLGFFYDIIGLALIEVTKLWTYLSFGLRDVSLLRHCLEIMFCQVHHISPLLQVALLYFGTRRACFPSARTTTVGFFQISLPTPCTSYLENDHGNEGDENNSYCGMSVCFIFARR